MVSPPKLTARARGMKYNLRRMELRCPACATLIVAEDVDLASGWAKCRECNDVFSFRKPGAPKTPVRADVPMPEKFEMTEQDGRLVIRWKWFSAVHLFLIFFSIAWWTFLILWYGGLISAVALSGGEGMIPAVVMGVFGLPFLAAGVFLVYFALAGLLNRTFVTVSRDRIEVRHRPLRWKGERTLSVADCAQLYCERHEHRGKNGVSHTYSVNVVTPDRRKIELVKSLSGQDQARFLEYKIETVLGIADERVEGEIPR